jgi:hypothetical protein
MFVLPSFVRQNYIYVMSTFWGSGQVRHAAKETPRRLKIENVAHDRDLPTLREEMIVIKAVEDSAHHGIAEMKGPLISSNATGKVLPDTKVFRTPGYFLSQAQQTGSDSTYRALAGMRRRGHMQIDAASQVERSLNGRGDFNRKLDYWHKDIRILSFRATKSWRLGKKVERHGGYDNQDGGDPPDRLHADRLKGRSELFPDELVVVEIFVG